MSSDMSNQKTFDKDQAASTRDGPERRDNPDRRNGVASLDQHRRAGIGEATADRRVEDRRTSDRRKRQERRKRNWQ